MWQSYYCHASKVFFNIRHFDLIKLALFRNLLIHTFPSYEITDIELSVIEKGDTVALDIMRTSAAVIGIHLYHSGKVLLGKNLFPKLKSVSYTNFLELGQLGIQMPFILIVGGTDVNELVSDLNAFQIMKKSIEAARFVVCFNESLKSLTESRFQLQDSNKLVVVKPSIALDANFDFTEKPIAFKNLQEGRNFSDYLALVANLRPVKDVLFIAESFSQFVCSRKLSFSLILIGNPLECSYATFVSERIKCLPHVYYIGSLSVLETRCLIHGAFALVNSSLSEGLSVSILEAMLLGTPVIARRIPGNTAVITDKETGLLYTTPAEFIMAFASLMRDHKLRRDLVSNAKNYVSTQHSCDIEAEAYSNLCHSILKTPALAL